MALEMARTCVLAAPMTQAEPKAVVSMTGVDKASSSDADGEREVANRQHPKISRVCVPSVLKPVFPCSLEPLSGVGASDAENAVRVIRR